MPIPDLARQPSRTPFVGVRRQERSQFGPYSARPTAPQRFASLDGLRAAAILVVCVNHLVTTRVIAGIPGTVLGSSLVGVIGVGVKMFFVLSGFLITSLLLREMEQQGTIDTTKFLVRRSLRIFPAYFTYVAVIAVLAAVDFVPVDGRDVMHAIVFGTNFLEKGSWYLGHLWSMASQEQFYLVWPLVLIVGGRRAASWTAAAIVIVIPCLRVAHATYSPQSFAVYDSSAASFDTMAVGCLLALHRDRLASVGWANRLVESRLAILSLFLAGNLIELVGYRPYRLLHFPLVAVALVLVLERCMRHPDGRLGRLLNSRPAVLVGSASFSIYLWQQLFISDRFAPYFPAGLILAAAAGLLSYHFIERPSMRLWPVVQRRVFVPAASALRRAA